MRGECSPSVHGTEWLMEEGNTALLCLQGREGEARRLHALFQGSRPAKGLPVDNRPVQELYAGVWVQDLRDMS